MDPYRQRPKLVGIPVYDKISSVLFFDIVMLQSNMTNTIMLYQPYYSSNIL